MNSLLDCFNDDIIEHSLESHLSLRRDLENLLNTRQRCLSVPREFNELQKSLMTYGIPDFTRNKYSMHAMQKELCEKLANIIRCFEPRFQAVSVKIVNNQESNRILKICIEGLLYAKSEPEQIVCESVINR